MKHLLGQKKEALHFCMFPSMCRDESVMDETGCFSSSGRIDLNCL